MMKARREAVLRAGGSSSTSSSRSSSSSDGEDERGGTTMMMASSSSPPPSGPAGPVIGIDLGTTNSVVAVCRKGRVEILANDNGSRITPSVVAFADGDASYVGDAARDLPPASQVFDAKRLIGRSFDDLDIQKDRSNWPFMVIEKLRMPKIRVVFEPSGRKQDFAPEEISALVLRSLKETAEAVLGEPVKKAVITVPAFFNERQRLATKVAGRVAGLEVVAMINEPTAAALAYGLDKKAGTGVKSTVFIFDLGGGTLDVSIMTIEGKNFRVVATGGDTHLGGQDFDARLMKHIKKDIQAKHGVRLDPASLHDLRRQCELAKRKLSALVETSVSLHFARHDLGYKTTVSRALFEDLCSGLFDKAMRIATAVLVDAKLEPADIDDVVLVGGSTRIPKVRSMLKQLFNGKELRHSINPDEAVAYGAAVHAAVLTHDEAVSKLVDLRDVTPLSLGVDVVGGRFKRIIPKNTPIPCKRTKTFTNVYDNQRSVSFEVYQGERSLVKHNFNLKKKVSISIPPKPAGEVSLDETFELDADGLLTVTCVEMSTGLRQKVTITREEASLSEEDIQNMIQRAEQFKTQDERETQEIEEDLRRKKVLP